jgi:hypothetical protein
MYIYICDMRIIHSTNSTRRRSPGISELDFPRISARHRHGSVETDVVGTWTIGLHVTWPRNPMEEKGDAFHVTETGDFTMKSGGLTWVKTS